MSTNTRIAGWILATPAEMIDSLNHTLSRGHRITEITDKEQRHGCVWRIFTQVDRKSTRHFDVRRRLGKRTRSASRVFARYGGQLRDARVGGPSAAG
jgi:hypothetical protein